MHVRWTRPWLPALLMVSPVALASAAEGPSFDCSRAIDSSAERLVCQDAELAALDRRMAEVYAAARGKAVNEHPPVLAATQRGWVKGRNDCWKAPDLRVCVRDSYRRRLVELQAHHRLLPGSGPVRYVCDRQPANEIVAMYFPTDPPSALVERGDRTSLMLLQPSASGTHYDGGNESLWEHQGEAVVQWGFDAPKMRCLRQP